MVFVETAAAVDQAKAQSSSAAVAPLSAAAAVIAEVIATPEPAVEGGLEGQLPEAAERPVSATIEGSQTVLAEVARAQMVHHQSSSQRLGGSCYLFTKQYV